jgi:hypothetical protein
MSGAPDPVDVFANKVMTNKSQFAGNPEKAKGVISAINSLKTQVGSGNPHYKKLDDLADYVHSVAMPSVGKRARSEKARRDPTATIKIQKQMGGATGGTAPPPGSLVLADGSVIDPVHGTILKPAGYVNPAQPGAVYQPNGAIAMPTTTLNTTTITTQPLSTTPAAPTTTTTTNNANIDRHHQ